MRRDLKPPSGGTRAPATFDLPGGDVLHVAPLAHEISVRFQREHPDEAARYGDAWFAWCVHDNEWLLAWAAENRVVGRGHFTRNVRWLAGLLDARGYPMEHLARDLEIAAEVVQEAGVGGDVARTLRRGATTVRRAARD